MNRAFARPLALGSLLWLAACVGAGARELDGDGVLPSDDRLPVAAPPGLVVEMQRPDVLAGPRLRTVFLARAVDGGAPIQRLIVEVWADDDGDGARGAIEAWTRVDVHEPAGRDWLAAHVQAWFSPGASLRYAVEVQGGGSTRIAASGAFQR